MSLRDLLSFNLFLQLMDGVVSYQAFALAAAKLICSGRSDHKLAHPGPRGKRKLRYSSKIKLHLKNRKFIHLYKEVFRLRSLTGKDL